MSPSRSDDWSTMPSPRRSITSIRSLPLRRRTLQDTLTASAQMAFMMIPLAIAAGVAPTPGVIGIYGVMSYIVTQRKRLACGLRLAPSPRALRE
jgi:hypothetical protein